MDTYIAYGLMFSVLGLFGYVGYRSLEDSDIDYDTYLSARNSQGWLKTGLSLFASGIGIWILFGPSEVGYYGGFWDVVGYALSAATPFLLLAYIGPMIRERLPKGVTLADYVRMKIGRPMQIYVGIISVLYMFTFLFAEFTAIGKAMHILAEIQPLIPMIAVGVVTAAYTSYGGLPASIRTDRWQAWIVIWLIVMVLLVIFGGNISTIFADAKAYNPTDEWSYGSISYMDTFSSGLALVIAITAAEMFSQGNWQRTYASKDDASLRKGALFASALALPLVFIMGFLGTVVAGQGLIPADATITDKSAAFFYLLEGAGLPLIAIFIVLCIALVCSSIDTLQNAVVASISRDMSDGKMNLKQARIVTLALIPIAIYLATEPTIFGWKIDSGSVFAIFLRADLLATATVLPVFLTLWEKIDSRAALSGAIFGIISVIIYGIGTTGDLMVGLDYIWSPTNEYGLANLNVFLSALLGSGLFTIIVSGILTIVQDEESE